MKQGSRETMVISEVLRANSSIIDHYNVYLNNCQDQQLRTILDRQQRHTLDTFQRLLQMSQSHGIDTSTMPLPTTMSNTMDPAGTRTTTGSGQYGGPMTTQQYGGTQQQGFSGQATMQYGAGYTTGTQGMGQQAGYQVSPPVTGAATGMATMLNDRVIAEGALMFHKFSAEVNTRAALESSEPHLRSALTNMARNCIEMSYEIYNYMSGRGWYQLPSTPQNFISHSTTQQQYPTQ